MSLETEHGIERVASPRDFAATVEKLESILTAKGLTIFARIDFSGDAQRAGLEMPATHMLIFGNPKAGTPVMLAAPSSALDLPLKVLVAQDKNGKVWISYNTPEYLAERHAIPAELLPNIAGIRGLVQAAAAAAA
jgi:uncharacterized protein (DUF302 family)